MSLAKKLERLFDKAENCLGLTEDERLESEYVIDTLVEGLEKIQEQLEEILDELGEEDND